MEADVNNCRKSVDNSLENLMPERPFFRQSAVRRVEQKNSGDLSPAAVAGRYCAYNRTRERFLCVDVEANNFSIANLNLRLPSLAPNSGRGLWILSFLDIPSTSVRVPLDLLYLDRNRRVLATIESFPLSSAPPGSIAVASILALPAQTIGSTGTSPGDILLLSHPDEMKRQLQELANESVETQVERPMKIGPIVTSSKDRPPDATGNVLQWVDNSQPKPTIEPLLIEVPPILPAAESVLIQPAEKKPKSSKNWLQRLLSPDPPDPRKATREALSWLAVYFFTGGNPVAQGIRDISVTGLYAITTERWYLGTVVRLTLIDRQRPTPDRSFTVNAKVVRSGEDGVGFHFIFEKEKQINLDKVTVGGLVECVNPLQIEEFLQRVRGSAS